jgi:hypothetical protein
MRKSQLSGLVLPYPGIYKLDRMPCQLVGLVNLGNTYYMTMMSAQPVLTRLQRVIMSLN